MEKRPQLNYLIAFAFFLVFILNANAQCDFGISNADDDLTEIRISGVPSEEQMDDIRTFLGASLEYDNYPNIGDLILNADSEFSPEEVQGVLSILCPDNCIFRNFWRGPDNNSSGVGEKYLFLQPSLSEGQLDLVIDYLGDAFVGSQPSGSAQTIIEVDEDFTAEQIQYIFSILCGPQCIYDFLIESSDQVLSIRPELTSEQLDALVEILDTEENPVTGTELNYEARTRIIFENPIDDEAIAIASAFLCPVTPIPTMGEWGLLILGLFIVVIGLVVMKDKIRKLALSMFSF